MTHRVGAKGQVVIPKDLRDQVGLQPGTAVDFALELELPGTVRMVETARLKARQPIALGDCFAIATAAAHELPLLTGDPEILGRGDLPCKVEDLRGVS